MDLNRKTASELSLMLQQKQCSAVELLTETQQQLQKTEHAIGAYITICDSPLQQAIEIDAARARGEALHPLAGIPLAVKDNISTRGIRTTCGSRMLEHYIPPFDATVIKRLRAAGTVMIGKTNMDEFGMGSSTETSYFHLTRNPHHPNYVPGGSSGGSAAAVAIGEAVLALGSDTGGSIRQPAAFCGVVGLKPTYGRVSRYGLVAYASSFDQIGPITRSVRDAALLLQCIAGYDPRDPTTAKTAVPDYSAQLTAGVHGLRIGVPDEFFGDQADEQGKHDVMTAIRLLEQQGAVLKRISLSSAKYALSAYYILASAEASSNLARFDGVRYGHCAESYTDLADMYAQSRTEGFGVEVKRRILFGTFVLSAGYYESYYRKAQAVQSMLRQEFETIFEECDLIALPTAPAPAFPFGKQEGDPTKLYQADLNTVPANLAGLPAISIPCGRTTNNLPIGLQLIGRPFDEQCILNTAYAYELLTGGFPMPAYE